MNEFYVGMQIDGKDVASSAVFHGTDTQCLACVARLMLKPNRHPSIEYVVKPCISFLEESLKGG